MIYEGFYRVYNPKAADRLGVIYAPNESYASWSRVPIVFAKSTFGRNLIDKDVEILDPAAGTGTFVCEMLEHFRGQRAKLKHKYVEENSTPTWSRSCQCAPRSADSSCFRAAHREVEVSPVASTMRSGCQSSPVLRISAAILPCLT